jgi:DNA-binding PadR family transcriptional regulator
MSLENQDYWKSLIGMSTCKFFLLQGLHQGPGHGYILLERMRSYTQGRCNASYGAVYPILKRLAEGNLALVKYENVGNKKRKVYKLTKKGESAYKEALKAWDGVLPYLNKAVEEDLH